MKIKFKDGKEIEFNQFGKIWLAESVIWEETELHGSLDELRILKAKINRWFAENAPKDLSEKFKARLPLWVEIEPFPFKDQIAYRKGETRRVAEYWLGDESDIYPAYCRIGGYSNLYGWFYCEAFSVWTGVRAVRICLEEKK